ncbi:unnamed protein product [Closterium sp. NIES-53]
MLHLVLRSRVPSPPILPQPPDSSLTVLHDPLSDYLRASRPIVSRVLSALVTHPSATLSSVSALITKVAGFASSDRLYYAAHLVSGPAHSPSSGGALVFPLEVLEDRQFEFGFRAAAVPHLCAMLLALEGDPDALNIPIPRTHAEAVSRPWALYWIATEDAEMTSYRSTGTYVDAVPPLQANVVSAMWLYKVKRPPGAPPVFKARYVARGFSQREGVEIFQTFAPTPNMTTLWVLLHIAAQRDYEFHSLDFSTAFLQGSLHEQIWLPLDFFLSSADPSLFVRRGSTPFFVLVYVDDLVFATPDRRALASVKEELQRRHTCIDLGELQCYLGQQITMDRTARTITLTQSHMVEQILTRFRFPFSKVQPTPLALDHGLMAPPSDEPFESSGSYPELVGCLMVAKYVASTSGMGLVLGGKQPATLTGYSDSSWADDAESLWSTQAVRQRCTLRPWPPKSFAGCLSSSPTLVSDHALLRLVGKAKHIQLRCFLLREFQQRGQARVVRVVSKANTADIFTKALPPCAHQRFCTQLGLCVYMLPLACVEMLCLVPMYLFLYISESMHVDWLCGPLFALRLCGDVVIHPELHRLLVSCCCRPVFGGSGGSEGNGGGRGGGSGGSGGGSGGFGGGGGGSDGGWGGGGGGSGSGRGGSGGGRVGAAQRGGSGGGQRQQQQRRSETPTPQQLREWFAQRGASGGSVRCLYVIRTGVRAGQTCRKFHTLQRCFSRLDDAWRAEFGDEAERPRWQELHRSGVNIFAREYDAIIAAMYALSVIAEGDYFLCVPPDPGTEAAALGASESALPGTTPAEALHTFTLDSGRHQATFTYRPGSSLYTLTTEPPQVAASSQVSASGQVAAPCSCRLLSHQNLLWHHRLGHPSLPRLRGMHSRLLVSGLPRSLPPLPPTPALPCLPCVEVRQHTAPHSSLFPPSSALLQTLHVDVWGLARVSGQGSKRYFLLVVEDYTRYTMVFPLHSKGQVPDVLIPWIRTARLQLHERFREDLPVLRLHSDRGGEFSSDLLREFCRGEGILKSFTLAASS